MNFGALPERLAHVRAEIARRQAARGWAHPVTLVAVTKGFGLDAVEAALAAGLTDLGENRVQEALEKIDTPIGRRATWHLIGHLQRNKAKHVPGRFALVHSLDSLALAVELDKRAAAQAEGARVRVLLQVNVAGEAQKSGCPPGEAPALARRIATLPHLALEGLMTIAPFTEDADVQRRTFRGLTSLRDALKEDGLWLATLSMGMSADYAIAVEEGATVIRLGTVLFGPRATGGAGGAGEEGGAGVAGRGRGRAAEGGGRRGAEGGGREAEGEGGRGLDGARAAEAGVERQAAGGQRPYQQGVGGCRAPLEVQRAELGELGGQRG